MWNYFLFIVYIALSAFGLLFIRIGSEDLMVNINSGIINLRINMKMLFGMISYICSFFLFVYILPKFNFTYLYPLAVGILYVIMITAGVVVLKERITVWQSVGMILILMGVIAMNMKK